MPSFDTIISQWLSGVGIKVSHNYLKQQLQTHPDYPSMLCITDTLEGLGIEYAAVQIEKEQLPEIPVPFLVHLTGNGGEWVIVKNRDHLDQQFPLFFERWKGTVLAAEKTEGWHNTDNEKELQKEKRASLQNIIILCLGFVFAFTIMVTSGSNLQASVLMTAIAGLFISWLIVSKDLGIDNKLANQVCGAATDCNAVIHSKAGKLPGGLSWGDIGLVWFSFQTLFLVISILSENAYQAQSLLTFSAIFYLPFAVFSLFYQWRIAKKWCRLCLMVVGILITQAVLLLPGIFLDAVTWPDFNSIGMAILLLAVGMIVWLPAKKLMAEKRRLESETWSLKRFKNNIDVFSALLTKQRKVDTRPWEKDLQIGNPDGAVQIIVACNPYCGPCTKAHQILHELAEANKELGITVRFTINADDVEDERTKVVKYIAELIESKRDEFSAEQITVYQKTLLHAWFQLMDIEKFKTLYPLSKNCIVDRFLSQQERWVKESKISATPTIFVNGFQLPVYYGLMDLQGLIVGLKTHSFGNNLLISPIYQSDRK
jgi:thiol-disulfide isomerase/thioredoxin